MKSAQSPAPGLVSTAWTRYFWLINLEYRAVYQGRNPEGQRIEASSQVHQRIEMRGLRYLVIDVAFSNRENRPDARNSLLSQPDHPVSDPVEAQEPNKDLRSCSPTGAANWRWSGAIRRPVRSPVLLPEVLSSLLISW